MTCSTTPARPPRRGRRTGLRAHPSDTRVSSCLFVPERPAQDLLVTVHGSERDALGIRNAFEDFAAAHQLVVLAPLFPARMGGWKDTDNYKFLHCRDVRFDELLDEMITATERRVSRDHAPVHLVGFSGGAQFVHRFCYLHPDRVASASVAAPGRTTLLDDTARWWAGTSDVPEMFGTSIDLPALRRIPMQIVVGEDDTGPRPPGRLARARALHDNYEDHAISARLDVVPGACHQLAPLVPSITDFLSEQVSSPSKVGPPR